MAHPTHWMSKGRGRPNIVRTAIQSTPRLLPSSPSQCNIMQHATHSSGRYAHLLKADVPRFHTSRTDLDNLVKLVLDSLNEHAYEDDRQVGDWGISVSVRDCDWDAWMDAWMRAWMDGQACLDD